MAELSRRDPRLETVGWATAFTAALADLQTIETRWPGLIGQVVTHRYDALDPATLEHLTHPAPGGIKGVLRFGALA